MEWLRKLRENSRDIEVMADTERTLSSARNTIELQRRRLEVMTGKNVPAHITYDSSYKVRKDA